MAIDPPARATCEGAGSPSWTRRDGALWCDEVDVAGLAARFGTPLYVYSAAALRQRIAAVRAAFGDDAHLCYAVKANSNLSLLRLVHEAGCGFDLVSGGELERLVAAGLPTDGAVFAGVAKQEWEIDAAVAKDILFFNVESPHELPSLSAAGRRAGRPVRVALRLNPDVDAGTHAYISTGKQHNKFGVAIGRAGEVVSAIAADPWLELVGYHVHLGSQLHQVRPYAEALQRVCDFVDGDPARARGVRYYDLGGGFGIGYGKGPELDVAAVAAALLPTLRSRGWTPVVEPGRFLIGDAGILVTAVLGEKSQGAAEFLLVDAAMNDLMRPALYQAEHPIVPVAPVPADRSTHAVDVVGPVCETGDFLARGRALPRCRPGDLLAVLAVGAYGASMASNYNTRRRAAEVLVDGAAVRLVRRRETFAGMFADELAGESAPDTGDAGGREPGTGER
ncbi:MAG: diaminopimelate decarboxylase [Planctomycetes bacterium]|nr:diaminopimelate decarboxylase [Planctomycetota bacterium]